MEEITISEVIRKVLHTLLAVFFAAFASFADKEIVIYLSIFIFIFFIVFRRFNIFVHLVSVKRVSFGELFFALGVMFTAIISLPNVILFQIGMLVLAFADTSATVFGKLLGKHKYKIFGETRTFEGSFACFLISVFIFIFFGTSVFWAVCFGFVLAFIEAFSPYGSDNLFLPITAVLLFILITPSWFGMLAL